MHSATLQVSPGFSCQLISSSLIPATSASASRSQASIASIKCRSSEGRSSRPVVIGEPDVVRVVLVSQQQRREHELNRVAALLARHDDLLPVSHVPIVNVVEDRSANVAKIWELAVRTNELVEVSAQRGNRTHAQRDRIERAVQHAFHVLNGALNLALAFTVGALFFDCGRQTRQTSDDTTGNHFTSRNHADLLMSRSGAPGRR